MNFNNHFNKRQSDNMPVFFTGLAESINNEPKVPLLCIWCGSSTANSTKANNDYAEVEDKNNHNGCENCTKHFNNLKAALSLLSQNSSFALKAPSETSSPQSKRSSLLPSPDQPSTSSNGGNAFTGNHLTDLKRKGSFNQNNSKRPKTGHSSGGTASRHNPDEIYTESYYEELSDRIWKLFTDNKQTQKVYKSKMALRDKLHEILLRMFPNCGLYVVGSSMTGLGGNSSDMDMCLMLTDAEIDQEREATNILHTVHSLIADCTFLTDVQLIYAKVPILRFTDRISQIEVDLNVNNAVGIRNTQLLSSYARIDKRLPPLVLLVKMWARYNHINDAKNNTLSSYSLVLMVIHYLQHACQPPVLPCLQALQPDKYLPHSDVRKLKLREELPNFTSENKHNVGDLFVGFLNYFAYEYDYFRSVMSVRVGGILPKEVAMNHNSPKNKKAHWKWVCIEEPFNLTNTACAVFKPDVFRYMKRVFEDSTEKIKKTADLRSIMN